MWRFLEKTDDDKTLLQNTCIYLTCFDILYICTIYPRHMQRLVIHNIELVTYLILFDFLIF